MARTATVKVIKNMRVTPVLEPERYAVLKKEASKRALSLPMFCKMLLSEAADQFKKNLSA